MGTLRQIVQIVNSGDTIYFDKCVLEIILTGNYIEIKKNLTIIGHTPEAKVTIRAGTNGIFSVYSHLNFEIYNLVLTGSKRVSGLRGSAVFVDTGSSFVASNCIFRDNSA